MKVKLTISILDWLDLIFVWPVLLYRYLKFGYAYRRIYLGQDEWTLVEPADYYPLKTFNWFLCGNGKFFYAFTTLKIGPGKTKLASMHRMLMDPPAHLLVDHHDNNSLDNRRANLRLATHSENCCNRQKIRTKTSSKYIGVYFEKRTGKWTSKIRIPGKRIWLGRFDSEIDAARAYDKAAKKYHKEFARLNFPKRSEGPRV